LFDGSSSASNILKELPLFWQLFSNIPLTPASKRL
jgi:hypothetical protein